MRVIILARAVLTPPAELEELLRNAGSEARKKFIENGQKELREQLNEALKDGTGADGTIDVKVIIKDDDLPDGCSLVCDCVTDCVGQHRSQGSLCRLEAESGGLGEW